MITLTQIDTNAFRITETQSISFGFDVKFNLINKDEVFLHDVLYIKWKELRLTDPLDIDNPWEELDTALEEMAEYGHTKANFGIAGRFISTEE